jgi:hypothetical protein
MWPVSYLRMLIFLTHNDLTGMSVNRRSRSAAIHTKTMNWTKKDGKKRKRAAFTILDKLNGKKRPKGA